MKNRILREFILKGIEEDIGEGDHSSMASIPENATGKAKLLIKEKGILAGVKIAEEVFSEIDNQLKTTVYINDGSKIFPGDVVLLVAGNLRSILRSERLVLNIIQRMSGIATSTREYADRIKGTSAKILDTRKDHPGYEICRKRSCEDWWR